MAVILKLNTTLISILNTIVYDVNRKLYNPHAPPIDLIETMALKRFNRSIGVSLNSANICFKILGPYIVSYSKIILIKD
jgi:hypothetical protein